jgi:hypothetical protein
METQTDFIVESIIGLRTGFTIFGVLIVVLAILFLSIGQFPQRLSLLLRSAAFIWAGAYTLVLWDMLPTLPREDILLMGIFPCLCFFVIPECVEVVLQGLYRTFDWPEPLKKVAFEQQKKQLDLSFRNQQIADRPNAWRSQSPFQTSERVPGSVLGSERHSSGV